MVSSVSDPAPLGLLLESFIVSAVSVALAEIGDKTQLLALILAARFRRPRPIIAGILIATLANHAIAAGVGSWISATLAPQTLRWVVAASFIAVACWILIPDQEDGGAAKPNHGAFLTTLIAFFIAEIGDKTQVATIVLAAKFHSLVLVVLGTTLGMMLANAPVVLAGTVATNKLPLTLIRAVSAALFLGLGLYVLLR